MIIFVLYYYVTFAHCYIASEIFQIAPFREQFEKLQKLCGSEEMLHSNKIQNIENWFSTL